MLHVYAHLYIFIRVFYITTMLPKARLFAAQNKYNIERKSPNVNSPMDRGIEKEPLIMTMRCVNYPIFVYFGKHRCFKRTKPRVPFSKSMNKPATLSIRQRQIYRARYIHVVEISIIPFHLRMTQAEIALLISKRSIYSLMQ